MEKQKCIGAMVFYYRSARSTHKMSFSKKSMFDIKLCRSKNVLAQQKRNEVRKKGKIIFWNKKSCDED